MAALDPSSPCANRARRPRSAHANLAVLLPLALAACAAEEPPPDPVRPNVILISIDTLRADHLGCYGYGKPTSPFIDSLAERGVRFERAFAQSSWTLPSHMSLFTGRYPHNHGVETRTDSLADSIITLPQVLKRAGYRTGGFVSWTFLNPAYGFGRGFDVYRKILPPKEELDLAHGTDADEVFQAAGKWLRTRPEPPFFLFVHLFDPHLDYSPPLEHARVFDPDAVERADVGRHLALRKYIKGLSPEHERIPKGDLERVVALYDGEIRFTDRELQRFFRQLEVGGLLDDTLVVLTSDHGELDDHGSMEGHQWTLFDEVTHVPLIVRFPGERFAGTRVGELVQSVDVTPTILSFAGVAAPPGLEGRDLMSAIRGEGRARPESYAFSSSERFVRRASVRTERYKLIRSERLSEAIPYEVAEYELYDLLEDPREQDDLYAADSEVAVHLRTVLDEWRAGRDASAPAGPRVELNEKERARLRALGYADDR